MSELKPCPFCGSTGVREVGAAYVMQHEPGCWFRGETAVRMVSAGGTGWRETDAEWNRRANSPAVRELVEAARVMIAVAQEHYDMECGDNGAHAIFSVEQAIASVEREEKG
jgi:hypothetical protein